MAYPKAWELIPPEIPPKGEKVSNQLSQFAGELRKQAGAGELAGVFANWLYDFEYLHPPSGGRTYLKASEKTTTTTTEKTLEAASQPAAAVADAAQVAIAEGRRLDRVLDSMAEGIRELRTGFAGVLQELRHGMTQLNAGYLEIREGNAQLQADERSFLGLLFPNMQAMMQNQIDSMAAYRKAVITEARAEAQISAAPAADSGSSEAEKAIMGLLVEAAKEKMGLGKPAAVAQLPAKKEEPPAGG